jgi:RNA polymerase sigma-70 factor (ECF subfamily)
LAADDEAKLDAETIASLYRDYSDGLRRFLLGVLRDADLAADALQTTFVKAAEQGHTSRSESRKAWLFRVAYNEAMLVRRRAGTGDRILQKVAWTQARHGEEAHEPVVKQETIEIVRKAIGQLPQQQQQILRMRIYEEKTFAVIADELEIPLGTALSRMRAATAKLREWLDSERMDGER